MTTGKLSSKSKWLLATFAVVYFLMVVVSFYLLLVYGVSTMFTTALVYSLAGILIFLLFNLLKRKTSASWIGNFQAMAFSLLVSLFIGELALRYIFKLNLTFNEITASKYVSEYKQDKKQSRNNAKAWGKDAPWLKVHKPSSTRTMARDAFSYEHKYNSLGWREEEIDTGSLHGKKIILGLGDSFTEGVGTHNDSTWLKFLQTYGNHDNTEDSIKTINAGISGSDVFFEYKLLEKAFPGVKPDVIVLTINTTDIDDYIIRGGYSRYKKADKLTYNPGPWWEPVYAVSFIARAAIHATNDLDWTLLAMKEKERQTHIAVDSIENCIRDFSAYTKQHDAKLVVVFNPVESEVEQGFFAYDTLATKLDNDSIGYILNLREAFAKDGRVTAASAAKYYWPTDLHNNVDGYKIWGEILAAYFRQNQIVANSNH